MPLRRFSCYGKGRNLFPSSIPQRFFAHYKGIWRFKTAASKMKVIALYDQLLRLQSAWSVKSFGLSLADQRIVMEVVFKNGQSYGRSLLTRLKDR
jgi:hypothetical protein